jgi:hypothetical protein
MPAPEKLFVNLTTKDQGYNKWSRSLGEPSPAEFPIFFYKDLRDFSLTFLEMMNTRTAAVFPSVVGSRVAIFSGATQLTSAPQDSIEGNEYRFILPITGTDMDNFMNGKTTNQLVDFHVRISTEKGGINRYKLQAYIAPAGISDTVPDPTITEPPITMSDATGVLLSKVWPPGGFMIVTDEVDASQYRVRVVNKEFKFEPLG